MAYTTQELLKFEFWRDFAPHLPIAAPGYSNVLSPTLDATTTATINAMMRREGYFQGGIGPWQQGHGRITALIQRLVDAELLPVFAFLYDPIWQLARQLDCMVSPLLGGNYRFLPDFWAWHVDPAKKESGWQPHRDKSYRALLPDGTPGSVTLWIPLTEANPLNSCMYIVPADRDPTYGTERDGEWKFSYADIRALPARPGDFFIWNQAVLHWGSHSSERATGRPRMSCAFEFQRADVAPWNLPLIEPTAELSFVDRQRLIGKQIKQYQHMYPLPSHLADLADRMMAA